MARGCQIVTSLALLAAMAGCHDTNRERELQAQIDQARAEKTASDEANKALRVEKTASDEANKSLQAQITQMRAEKTAFDEANRLVGTWRYHGSPLTYKLVTPTSWALLEVDGTGRVSRSKGGTYTLQGSTYVEKIEYDSYAPSTSSAQAQHTFTCEIDGDTWHHKILSTTTDSSTGKTETTILFHEVWDRIKP
jgi:hypothetical protein